MVEVPSPVLKRIKERLIGIQHPEVRLWEDEFLKTAVFENSSNWFELLKWLLITLDDSLASFLENVDQSSLTHSLQDVVIGLGLVQSFEEFQKCFSGKVSIKERERFCNSIISAIEMEKKCSQDDCNESLAMTKTAKNVSFEEYRSFGKMAKKGTKKDSNAYNSLLMETAKDNVLLCASGDTLEELKVKCQFQVKDENLTVSQYLDQLKEESKRAMANLVELASSVEQFWQSVCEMQKSELEPLLPVNIGEAKKMPMLKQLSSKIDFLTQHQETLQTVQKSVAVLQGTSTIHRELEWSVKNTESLPVNDCFKQIYSVKTQIMDLNKSAKLNNTSVMLNNTSVLLNNTCVKFNNTSVKSNSTIFKFNVTEFI